MDEGDYSAFVAIFLMRLFYAPTPALAPIKDDESGSSKATAQDDKPVCGGGFDDGPTEYDWRVTTQDVYGALQQKTLLVMQKIITKTRIIITKGFL